MLLSVSDDLNNVLPLFGLVPLASLSPNLRLSLSRKRSVLVGSSASFSFFFFCAAFRFRRSANLETPVVAAFSVRVRATGQRFA